MRDLLVPTLTWSVAGPVLGLIILSLPRADLRAGHSRHGGAVSCRAGSCCAVKTMTSREEW